MNEAKRAGLATLLAMMLSLGVARAMADPPSQDSAQAAEEQYAKGLRLLQEGHPAEALEALDASAKTLPSPNTDLLRGHALRALDRRVEAMDAYERVVRDAGALVRRGDKRFEATLADAGTWIAVLRTALAELTIEVRTGTQDVLVQVNGRQIEVVRDVAAGIARARMWREPGRAKVVVKSRAGAERSAEADIGPGATQSVSLDLDARPSPKRTHAPPVATWVVWGASAAGFLGLAVAGGLALSAMSDLDKCTPRCSTDDVDATRTKATIANVGLGLGIAGALAGGAIWLGVELAARNEFDSAGNHSAIGAGLVWTTSGPALGVRVVF